MKQRKIKLPPPERREVIIEAGTHLLGRLVITGPRGAETNFEAFDCGGKKIGDYPAYERAVHELLAAFVNRENSKCGN